MLVKKRALQLKTMLGASFDSLHCPCPFINTLKSLTPVDSMAPAFLRSAHFSHPLLLLAQGGSPSISAPHLNWSPWPDFSHPQIHSPPTSQEDPSKG